MESSTKSTTRHVEANVNRQKENHDNQNISNEVEDAIICHKSASDGGALRKENQDNQNRSKKAEDAIVCHKSASDGGALQKENQDNQNNINEVEDTIVWHKSGSDGGALAGMSCEELWFLLEDFSEDHIFAWWNIWSFVILLFPQDTF